MISEQELLKIRAVDNCLHLSKNLLTNIGLETDESGSISINLDHDVTWERVVAIIDSCFPNRLPNDISDPYQLWIVGPYFATVTASFIKGEVDRVGISTRTNHDKSDYVWAIDHILFKMVACINARTPCDEVFCMPMKDEFRSYGTDSVARFNFLTWLAYRLSGHYMFDEVTIRNDTLTCRISSRCDGEVIDTRSFNIRLFQPVGEVVTFAKMSVINKKD